MGDNSMRLENYEMLKALYNFKATFSKTLSFQEGDYFILYQTNTKQRNWWQVVNKDGQIGYIPSNYVTTVKVSSQILIEFLEDCIGNVKTEMHLDKQDLLLRLIEKKRQAETYKKTKRQAPKPPEFGNTTPNSEICSSPVCNTPEEDVHCAQSNTSYMTAQTTVHTNNEKEETPIIPQCQRASISEQRVQSQSLPRQASSESQKIQAEVRKSPSQGSARQTPVNSPIKKKGSLCDINSHTAYQLLDQNVGHYFDALLHQLETPFTVSQMSIEETYDANRLKVIFTELTSCKEDSQQRNWMLYEDEAIIVDYIKELTSILTNADANVSRYVLQQNQYNGVNVLIQYYQMEPRWTIRQLLLQSFGVMCSLDSVILTIMLNSVLPMELARDMRSNPRNVTKLNYSSLLLTMIFSMGEPMPVTHLEQLGPDFIAFILDLIENPPDMDLEDQIPDLFVNLILSYNLQFTNTENIVLNALKERTGAKFFTEKILLLFNREEDPVRIFDHEPPPPHSVLKLFIDLFSNDVTAGLFYTNDVKVLIDIILRQLYDMFPGDKRRQYLELCRRVLRTSSYNEHKYRSEDLLKCFTRIFCEETGESQEDQQSVREISNEFPHLFKM
ncbi:NCK-interacting protein with SH3 domain [Anthophora retusa]